MRGIIGEVLGIGAGRDHNECHNREYAFMHTAQSVRHGSNVVRERYHRAARMFFAGADPARLKILLILRGRKEACVSDLARELGMTIQTVSHHLRLLRECKCLATVRSGRMVCYEFVASPFTEFVLSFLKDNFAA